MVLVQKWQFLQHFFFRQYRPGKRVLRYSRTKKNFVCYKKKFKKLINWHFSKGLTHAFGPKIVIFFLGSIGQENMFYDILKANNTFLAYKNEKFKKLKNWHFSMLLVQKWPFFQGLISRHYRPGKCVLRYSRTTKHLSSL